MGMLCAVVLHSAKLFYLSTRSFCSYCNGRKTEFFAAKALSFPINEANSSLSLDKGAANAYNIFAFGVWRSLVSRLVRDQEATGSNPVTPTKNPVTTFVVTGFFRAGIRKGGTSAHTGVNKCPVDICLARGRIHCAIDAPLRGVDLVQSVRLPSLLYYTFLFESTYEPVASC